ncbi:MAG: hypothetical protein KGI06_06075 [Candidatus Micrarchaeota archaeon]|nr:hypothetical protein [Candidatus Micrarchaeota archaeon]
MAPDARFLQVYQAFGWTTTTWMAQGTDGGPGALPAGVTLVPGGGGDPVHPFAGALGEQVLKFAAGSSLTISSETGAGNGVTPTATKRWALIWSGILWLPAYPAAEGTLLSGANDPFALNVTPAGALRLYTGSGLPLVGTSTAVLPTGQWLQLEVWEAYRDSAGNLLTTKQWVVRTATLTAPPVYTTFLNVNANPSQNLASGGFTASWGSTSSVAPFGLNPLFYVCNVWGGWEDAANPMGVHRVDGQRPSVVKGVGHWNQWPGNPAHVNEALPDGTTTQDTAAVDSGNSPWSQLYRLTDPAYIAAADLLTDSLMLGEEISVTPGAKGVTNNLFPMMSDGVNDHNWTALALVSGYQEALRLTLSESAPWSSPQWTLGQLTAMQAGAQATSNATGGSGNNAVAMSTVLMLVPYQKAGETGTALPAPVTAGFPYSRVVLV